MFGSPMDASGFGTLAEPLRRTGRWSPTTRAVPAATRPGTDEVTPEQHAEDLHRVVEALGVGPVDCFGTSGGAVNAARAGSGAPRATYARGGARAADARRGCPTASALLAAIDDMKATYRVDGQRAGDGEVHRSW